MENIYSAFLEDCRTTDLQPEALAISYAIMFRVSASELMIRFRMENTK